MAKRIVDEEMRFNVVINGNAAQKELYDLEKRNRQLADANRDLRAEKKKLREEGKRDTAYYKELTAEINKNSAELTENKKRMQSLRNQIGVSGLTMSQLRKEAARLRIQLNNMTPGSKQYKELEADLRKVNARMTQLRNGSRATQGALSKVAGGFNKYAALGASVIATVTGMVVSFQKFIDFSGKLADAQSNVQKTTGLTKKEVSELTKEFGLFNTRTTRIELLELAEEAGRLGIEGKRNISAFVQEANKLKVALGDDLSTEQIREVGKMTNIYKVGAVTGKDFAGSMDALGSSINEVSASGANQAGFLVEYLKRQAGVAAQAKISAADNIGYAATFDEIGQSVEVAATAMNKVVLDMFQNPGEYARIAGMEIRDFNKLLQEDSNEAMLRFLEGLNGNNEGLEVMVQKMDELDAGGTRGVQALAALASSTELLRKRQETANKSLREATSLTNEYNLKNENLAAKLQKVKRFFVGLVTPLIGGFTSAIDLLDKFTSSTESNVKALEKERLKLFEVQSQLFSTNITTEDRLKLINELKASYPKLLENLNAETASNEDLRVALKKVNDELINRIIIAREQDKIDKQNEKTADKMEEYLKAETRLRESVAKVAQNVPGFQFDENKSELQNAIALATEWTEINGKAPGIFKQVNSGYFALKNSIDGYRLAQNYLNSSQREGNKLLEERDELMKRLGLTNTDASGGGGEGPEGPQPEEGDTKFIAGELYVYKNGRWEKVVKPTGPGAGTDKDPTIDILRKNLELKNQLIKDDFERELAMLWANHNKKIDALEEQLKTKGKLTEKDIERNAAIREQIQLENEIFDTELATLAENSIERDLKATQEKYQREKQLREIALKEALASNRYTEEEKKQLQEDYNRDELIREANHAKNMLQVVQNILDSGSYKGIDLELLTEEQKQELIDRLNEIKEKLAELGIEINSLSGKGGGDSFDSAFAGEGNVDILGLSVEQWATLYDNLDTTQGKIEAVVGAVTAMGNAWAMFNQFANQNDQARLQKYEAHNQQMGEALKRRYDAGLINERQYNEGVRALEKELQKQQAETEYKQAKRAKETAVIGIVTDTARAIMGIWADFPKADFGATAAIASAAVGALGAIQLAMVARQPLPARGFEKGYYGTIPVRREQDGKIFDAAYGGESRSGMVNKPTMFLAGEQGKRFPELIVSGPDLKRFDPQVRASIANELRRIRGGISAPGFENGYEGNSLRGNEVGQNNTYDPEMIQLLAEVSALLRELRDNGVIAYISKDMKNINDIQEELERLNKYKSKAVVNGS